MSKKSLIASLILGAITTLSLGVYTLVSAIVALTTPHHTTRALAYTDTTLVNGVAQELVINDFANYSESAGTLAIKYNGEDKYLEYNADENTYSLAKDADGYTIAFGDSAEAGAKVEFVAVATTDKYGSTITYNVSVYHQGSGASETDPYIVANAEGLKTVADDVENDTSALREGFIDIVEDIDMAGVEYAPIGKTKPFFGTFDGNGKTIKNLSIIVDENNYANYLRYNSLTNTFDMTLGLFGWTGSIAKSAKINGVAMSNATVRIEDNAYDKLNQTIEIGGHAAKFGLVRAGLLVGEAFNTIVDGSYSYDVETQDEEGNPVVETKTEIMTVAGTVSGLQFDAGKPEMMYKSSFGGLVGAAQTGSITTAESAGSYKNYKVAVTMATSTKQAYDWVGGVFGLVLGTDSLRIEASDLEVTLNARTQFHQWKYVAGVASFAQYFDAENINVTTSAIDSEGATIQDLNAIISAETYTADSVAAKAFSRVAGVATEVEHSTFKNITSNANISLWTKISAGFIVVEDSELENVVTSGSLTGYNVSGLAHTAIDSEISYNNTEEEALVAANVTLFGHDSAALVDYADSTNIKATGSVEVSSETNISAYGYRVTRTQKNNIVHSSGLVGYFYSTDTNAANTYELSGFVVKAVIKNGVDMAGVVTYLGNPSTSYAAVKVANITVDADLESYSQNNYASTHKAAGAVATVYGNATLDHVVANVNFNKDHGTGSYGAAMFGGLVARVGGKVEIANSEANGSAYINDSIYKITLTNGTDSREFTQILAGGLVGAIARFTDVAFVPGTHPVYTTAINNYSVGDTRDELLTIAPANVKLTDNKANVDITIDYKETYEGTSNAMYGGGYKVRSAGSLVGLFLNEGNPTTSIASNHAYGIIVADQPTFSVGTSERVVSTCGYGTYNAASGTYAYTTPAIVGCTTDLVNTGTYNSIWAMPQVEEKPVVAE